MSATADWWEEYERKRIAREIFPFPGATPGETRFKKAALELIAEGLYPSGRQIYKRLGKSVEGKVNLNGRECRWLNETREAFGIEPYVGYTARRYRDDWNEYVNGGHGGPKYPYKLRRGPRGTLVVCEEYIDNRVAEQKALEHQIDNDRYGVNA